MATLMPYAHLLQVKLSAKQYVLKYARGLQQCPRLATRQWGAKLHNDLVVLTPAALIVYSV